MLDLIHRLFERAAPLAGDNCEPDANPAPVPDVTVVALRQIATRYRDLQASAITAEARDLFGGIAAEYEARADRIEAERR